MDFGLLTLFIRLLMLLGWENPDRNEALLLLFLIICIIGALYFHSFLKGVNKEIKEFRQSMSQKEERFNDRMDIKVKELKDDLLQKDREIIASLSRVKKAVSTLKLRSVYMARTLKIHGEHFDVNDKNIDRAQDLALEAIKRKEQ